MITFITWEPTKNVKQNMNVDLRKLVLKNINYLYIVNILTSALTSEK